MKLLAVLLLNAIVCLGAHAETLDVTMRLEIQSCSPFGEDCKPVTQTSKWAEVTLTQATVLGKTFFEGETTLELNDFFGKLHVIKWEETGLYDVSITTGSGDEVTLNTQRQAAAQVSKVVESGLVDREKSVLTVRVR